MNTRTSVEQRAQHAEKMRAFRATTEGQAYHQNWIAENKEAVQKIGRRHLLKRRYGITLEEYDALFVRQSGTCALCQRPPQRRRLAVDHDHETGEIRGLLCVTCNSMLGHLEGRMNLDRVGKYLTDPREHI
jgi:hypothetical protein